MRSALSVIFMLLAVAVAMAQGEVSGTVVDNEKGTPLPGASVVVKRADGKILKFATTKGDGGFAIAPAPVAGSRLEVSMIGYTRQSVALDSVVLPVTVRLSPGNTLLKEVTVKADRIREQGDTISYTVGTFAQEQDRTIGDVLRRMPGIDVENSGKIKYQGEDINKFYIEGSDLLGGKYGVATNGISHEDVGAVEVMENHQPLQVLSGMAYSDKAAINLRLKGKAKATWSFHGDAAGGRSAQPEGALWSGELFAMAVMPEFQDITTIKTNNTGEDLSGMTTDFFASRRGTGLSPYVGVSLPGVPDLGQKRTLFNRSALASSNFLRKFGRGEVKAQIDYSFNRIVAEAKSVTTYFLAKPGANGDDPDGGGRVVTENRDGRERSHSLSGKVIYELNRKTAFINNTLRANVDWDDVRLGVTGSLSNSQTASLPDYYVGNEFKMIKRFSGNRLVTFESRNEWESMPQTLAVRADVGSVRQHVGDHAFFTDERASYAWLVKGVTISLEAGLSGCFRSMRSDVAGLPDELSAALPDLTNVVSTNCFTIYAKPKLEYRVKRVNIRLDLPVNYAIYHFDKALANRNEVYFSPSLGLDWKPNNRFSIDVHGGADRSPVDLSLIQPGCVMTDYRSFRRGVDNFYSTTSQNVSARLAYKHTRRGLFANAMVMQLWSRNPYTLAQQLFGDYVVYSYSPARSDGQMLTANADLGKTLDFMRGSVNLNGRFNRRESHLLSEGRSVSSTGTSWAAGVRLNGQPLRWLGVDYRFDYSSSRLVMNGAGASWLGSMQNELLVNIMPHKRWQWHISGEHYRNELTAGSFKCVFLLDTKVVYKLGKRVELSASLSNIFNRRTYRYTTYSQLTSFESLRMLRGREFLLSISLRK